MYKKIAGVFLSACLSLILSLQLFADKKEKAFNFKLKDENGKEIKLSDFKGKYVHIDFSADWCPPCHYQAGYMKDVEEKLKDKNFVSITVLGSNPTKETIEKWKKNYHLKYVLFDTKTPLSLKYFKGNFGIPANVIIKPDQTIAGTWEGAIPSADEFVDHVKTLAPELFKEKLKKKSKKS